MPGIYGREESYIFKGVMYRKPYLSSEPYFPFGNCSVVNFGTTPEKKEIGNFTRINAGNANSIERVQAIPLNITMHDMTPQNLAIAMGGTATAVTAATVTDEEITVFAGAVTPLANLAPTITGVKSKDGDTAPARANSTPYLVGDFYVPAAANGHYYKVTVAGTSDSIAPTFTTDGTTFTDGTATVQDMGLIVYPLDGTHFTTTLGGVHVPDSASFGGISATVGIPLLVSYSHTAQHVVQAGVSATQEWTLYFEGANEMQSGQKIRGGIYRAKFSTAQIVDLVGSDPGGLQITGEALVDSTITDPTKSSTHYVELEDLAA